MSENVKKASVHEVDMTNGSLFKKILIFSLPLMATGVLQLLFNAADMVVVGQFVSETALAAVGSTGSLAGLIVNFFIGLSAGAGVVMSKHYGSKDSESADRLLHTAMPISLISGIVVMIFGLIFSRELLILMNTEGECLELATQYLVIYFIGAPFNLVYNFGASMLRATGDTVRPLLYLTLAGVINIMVNLVAVLVLNQGVRGVAYATIVSQLVSAILVVLALRKNKGFIKLSLRKIKIYKQSTLDIIRLGVPSGVQSSLFAISNMIIQATINDFGEIAMAGTAAARQLESFLYVALNAVANGAVTAVGQNYGAKNYKRIRKSIYDCLILVTVTGLIGGLAMFLFNEELIRLYTKTPEATAIGVERLNFFICVYVLCGIMDVVNCSMRGMGFSFTPMAIVLIGTCVMRVGWVYVVFPLSPTLLNVYVSYPVSWILTALVGFVVLLFMIKKREKRDAVLGNDNQFKNVEEVDDKNAQVA